MIVRGFVYDVTTGRLREVQMTGGATRTASIETDSSKA
jgi:hypothetical protein